VEASSFFISCKGLGPKFLKIRKIKMEAKKVPAARNLIKSGRGPLKYNTDQKEIKIYD
jgi:hypothetical protein